MSWQLQDAKNRLSEVVKAAEEKGPQVITVRGEEKAVIVSMREYRKISARKQTLSEFLSASPLKGLELDMRHPQDIEDRDIGL